MKTKNTRAPNRKHSANIARPGGTKYFLPLSDNYYEGKEEMVYGISPASFSGIGNLNLIGGSRMSLPVAPSDYIYAQFEHVSGIPAREGVQGIAISRLKILDTLIDQLQKIKMRPDTGSAVPAPEKRIDVLVGQICRAEAAHKTMPYSPQVPAPRGVVFDFNL